MAILVDGRVLRRATFFSGILSDAFWDFFPHCLWSGVATKRKRKRTSAGGKGQKSRRRRRKRKRRKRGGRRKKRRRRRRRPRREEKEQEKEKALPAASLQITIQYTVYTSHVRMVALTGKSEI